jgi:hypothetical protein
LAADEPEHFDITFTAPGTPGDISFPVIQTCQQGETAWIEPIVEGAAEPEHPAPTIKVTAGAPTAAELTPVPDATDASGTVVATGTEIATTLAATSKDSSNAGTIVIVVIAAVIVVVGALAMARRRKTTSQPPSSKV